MATFISTLTDYQHLQGDLKKFSALKNSAFCVFNEDFDPNQLIENYKNYWVPLCNWSVGAYHLCKFTEYELDVCKVKTLFNSFSKGEISRETFHNTLKDFCSNMNNYEQKLTRTKDERYNKLISLYNEHAKKKDKLDLTDPQVFDWFMDLLQS